MVISGVISPLIRDISIVTLLMTPLLSTHEPPSRIEMRHCRCDKDHDQEEG